MPFSLSLIGKDPSGVVLIAAKGEARFSDFFLPGGNPRAHFDVLLGENWAKQRVLVSMDEVSYLVSSAIGWLLTSQKEFHAAGGHLVIHSVQPSVLGILSLLKVEKVVPIAQDLEAGRLLQIQQADAAV